jgi:Arthropod defensin
MMFRALFAVFIIVLIGAVSSTPVDGKLGEEVDPQARLTCDVLGFTGNFACNLHCVALGNKSGSCSDGICCCKKK